MKLQFLIRLLVAAAISLGLAASLFYVTDFGFQIWERLSQAPAWFIASYAAALLLLLTASGYWLWRLLRPRSRRVALPPPIARAPPTETDLRARLVRSGSTGADTTAARAEFEELGERRARGEVYIALFGEVSTGKSSLVKALLPEVEVAIDPRGGTTQAIAHYAWTSPEGDRLVVADMPGTNAADQSLDEAGREEAQRAHAVIYLVDGDLTRAQYRELQQLLALEKPVILAINKVDQLHTEDFEAIRGRLIARLGETHTIEVVPVCAGGQREVIKVYADGREESTVQEVAPRVEELISAVLRCTRREPESLERLRDAAVLRLVEHKLEGALAAHRRKRSEELINQYTRNAVLGALAAVSPGTDIIIQGYLAVAMVRAQCRLYEVSIREVDIERFLTRVSKDIGKSLPLVMAAVGNALKAFPGMGTLAGGVLHAVGYGLIFESLGRAVAATLDQRGDLATASTLRWLKENLNDDLEARVRRLAKLALGRARERSP